MSEIIAVKKEKRKINWGIKYDEAVGFLFITVMTIISYSLLFQFAKRRQSMSLHAGLYGQNQRMCGPPAISLHLNKLSIGFRELLSLLG